jgi:hypothetical protein
VYAKFLIIAVIALIFLIKPISTFATPPDNLIIEHGPRNSHKIALTFDA